ncbi:DUF6925 family protein [Methylopila henanensis]|uniref:DUF6925 family protein n=1 Tax=Methylopila henanensis TaxID=873516 RepID=A0ABW4K953_9HYPH
MTDVASLLEARLACADTHWHMGTFGVVAEFSRDPDEPAAFPDGRGLAAFTARGAIRLEPSEDLTLFAYEGAMSRARSWSQHVALCLPRKACALNRRAVLTELGPDREAVRADDRDGVLFDLGLARLQMDALIRTTDKALIDALRAAEGKSLFGEGSAVMGAIFRAQPHRVFVTRFGRVEVFQPIPMDGTFSPPGPHTHLLPKLMKTGRTHGANVPAPKGLVPCGGFAPPHPARKPDGVPHAFDAERHAAFQDLLDQFGDPRLVAVKRAARDGDADPALAPATRHERAAARVGALQALARTA